MPAIRPRVRAVLVAAAATGLVVFVAGGTFAASNPPTLYACYDVYGNVKIAEIPHCKLSTGGRLVPINAAGVPGPLGPAGVTGATGPTGPTGASTGGHAYEATASTTYIATGASVFPTTVATLDLPAGRYVVMASGTVSNVLDSMNWVTCEIVDGGPIARQSVQVANENAGAYSMVGTADLADPATVSLQCTGAFAPGMGDPAVDDNDLVAMEVGALN